MRNAIALAALLLTVATIRSVTSCAGTTPDNNNQTTDAKKRGRTRLKINVCISQKVR